MDEDEYKYLMDYLNEMGPRVKYVKGFVEENFDGDREIEEVLLDNAISPFYYYKKRRQEQEFNEKQGFS